MSKLDADEFRDTSNLIQGALDRVAREQGDDVAVVAAMKNVYGNIAYLRHTVGDVDVVELLGEIRETVLANAKERVIG